MNTEKSKIFFLYISVCTIELTQQQLFSLGVVTSQCLSQGDIVNNQPSKEKFQNNLSLNKQRFSFPWTGWKETLFMCHFNAKRAGPV